MKPKVLIVEDEVSIRGFIKINLERNNFSVVEAGSGEEALEKIPVEAPQIVILDVMLPGIDGFQICERLRKNYGHMGIMMLTARSQDLDKIMGLEFGADDYMVKPFNPLELIARVKAILRRSQSSIATDGNQLVSLPFKIDLVSQKVYKNEIEIDLTPKEFLLMKVFIENPGKALSRDMLLNMIWGLNYIGDLKIVDVNIRRLREKIEDLASKPTYIETVWGTGYRWRRQ
jgi:two-component system, OmpR family, alkaline phosphatase synthesis response regulator PhoP